MSQQPCFRPIGDFSGQHVQRAQETYARYALGTKHVECYPLACLVFIMEQYSLLKLRVCEAATCRQHRDAFAKWMPSIDVPGLPGKWKPFRRWLVCYLGCAKRVQSRADDDAQMEALVSLLLQFPPELTYSADKDPGPDGLPRFPCLGCA